MTKHKKAGYTILLVCEGENTEPYYFQGIRDLVEQDDIWIDPVKITIRPEPKHEDEHPELSESKYKTPRRRRKLSGENTEIQSGEPPLKLIVKAQVELQSGAYDEVWAIFDHDNHPKRKEAFELAGQAVDNKRVNIAFSSISFETWVLLHFERCLTAFEKAECRHGKDILGCNSGIHPNDCYGSKCLCGYLRQKNYVPFSTKGKQSLFPFLKSNLNQALINAAWLRYKVDAQRNQVYDLNPYTDVDRLVAHLLQFNDDITWGAWSNGINYNGYQVTFSHEEGQLIISFKNNMNRTWIINPKDICIIIANTNEKREIVTRKTIPPHHQDAETIRFPESEFYIRISLENKIFYLD